MTSNVTHSGPTRSRRILTALARALPLAPATLMVLGFFMVPIVWAVYASLTDQGLSGSAARNPKFIGIENYFYLFTDQRTWDAILRTAIFVVFSVIGQNVIGFTIAYVRQQAAPWIQSLVTTIIITAWVVPEVVAAFLWYTFLRGESSGLNQIFHSLGLPPQEWLVSNPLTAVIVINIWRGCAFSLLVYSAALQDVSREVIEAAHIDGAGTFHRIFDIVLPMIRSVAATNVVLTTLSTLGVFGLIWITTAGGPGSKSETLPILMYKNAYDFGMIGYGSSIAVVLLGLGVILSTIYVRLFRIGGKP